MVGRVLGAGTRSVITKKTNHQPGLIGDNGAAMIDDDAEELVLDSDDEEYDADEVEEAEAIAAELLDGFDYGDAAEHEADTGIDYRNPFQPIDRQELVNIGWCQLSRSLPQKMVPIHRDFWHAAGAMKAGDQRTARQRLADLTGIRLVRYECCPESHVCYEDPKYRHLQACPKTGCGKPRYTGRERIIRGRKRKGEADVVIKVSRQLGVLRRRRASHLSRTVANMRRWPPHISTPLSSRRASVYGCQTSAGPRPLKGTAPMQSSQRRPRSTPSSAGNYSSSSRREACLKATRTLRFF